MTPNPPAPQSAMREALTRLWSVVSDHLEYPHEPLVIENNLATAINSVLSAPPLAIQIPLGVGAHEAQVIIEQTRAALSAPEAPGEREQQLETALREARPLVYQWCHYQGNTKELFDKYLGPIDALLAGSKP